MGLLGKLLGGLLDGLGHLFLTLGESDNATGDTLALSFTVATLTLVSGGVFGLVVVVLHFVKNEGAAKNAVGARKHDKSISVLVLGLGVPTALDLLDITDATLMDVLVRVATVGTEGVEDVTSGLAAVLEVAELVDLQSVDAGLDASELTDHGHVIAGLLLKSDTAAGVRVSEEVEFAGSLDGLLLDLVLPESVNLISVVGLHVTGTVSAAAAPIGSGVAVVRVVSMGVGGLVGSSLVRSSLVRSGLVRGSPVRSRRVGGLAVSVPLFSFSGLGTDHDRGASGGSLGQHVTSVCSDLLN